MKANPAKNVDEYIDVASKEAQSLLKQMRKAIKTTAPKAEESISYGMPAYKYLGKPLVYYGAFEKHIGFYATPTGHETFKKELAIYKSGKGSVQFPIDKKLPLKLIERIIRFRVKENEVKAIAKK